MASTFDLPKELRLMIFRYVFTSPWGVIVLVRFPPMVRQVSKRYKIFTHEVDKHEGVSLSILRTCKKFYWDCKDLLWKQNTLDLESLFLQSSWAIHLRIDERVWNNVRSIQLDIGFTHCPWNITRETWLESYLKVLGSWKNLNSITFNVLETFHACCDAIYDASRSNPNGVTLKRYLDLFKSAGGEDGYLLHLERKIVFDFGHLIFNDYMGPAQLVEMERQSIPDEIFTELAISFGGDIIVNGDIYYSNRIQKKRVFYALFDSANSYFQHVWLAKQYALEKLAIVYANATKCERHEVREHLLGRTVLHVSKEDMAKVRAGVEEWFTNGPKQLVDLTKKMIEEKPLEIEEQFVK